MKRLLENQNAEREANDIAFRFANSTDVAKDLGKVYDYDFSGVKIHTDEAADERARGAGRDALAGGNDIYFAKGIYETKTPERNALLAHEMVHIMQQSGSTQALGLENRVEYGAEEGGLLDWFRNMTAARKFKSGRAAAKKNIGSMGTSLASVGTLMGAMNIADDAVAASNASFDGARFSSPAERRAVALASLGHGNIGSRTGQNNEQLHREIFSGSRDAFSKYASAMDGKGVNYGRTAKGLSDAEQSHNSFSTDVAMDFLDIMQNSATSEAGLDYFKTIMGQVEGAKVFTEGGANPLDYAMSTFMNSMVGDSAVAGQSGKQSQDKTKLFSAASKQMQMLPAIAAQLQENGGDLDALELDPDMKRLYLRYADMKNSIGTAVEGSKSMVMQISEGRNKTARFRNQRGNILGRILTRATSAEINGDEKFRSVVAADSIAGMNKRLSGLEKLAPNMQQSIIAETLRGNAGEMFNFNTMIGKMLPEDIAMQMVGPTGLAGPDKVFQNATDFLNRDYAQNPLGVARLTEMSKHMFDNVPGYEEESKKSEFAVNNLMLRNIVPSISNLGAKQMLLSPALMSAINTRTAPAGSNSDRIRTNLLQLFARRRG